MGDVLRVIINLFGSTPQNDMHIRIAAGLNYGCPPFPVDAKKTVRMLCSLHGINCNLQVSVSAILEADRKRQAAGHFTMGLGLCSAGAYGAPADEIGHILRSDRIKHF